MDPLSLVIATAQASAALAIFGGFITTIGQARIVCTAIDAIARQPAATGTITSTMFIGLAMAETNGIYGLLISIILLFANPLLTIFLQNMVR